MLLSFSFAHTVFFYCHWTHWSHLLFIKKNKGPVLGRAHFSHEHCVFLIHIYNIFITYIQTYCTMLWIIYPVIYGKSSALFSSTVVRRFTVRKRNLKRAAARDGVETYPTEARAGTNHTGIFADYIHLPLYFTERCLWTLLILPTLTGIAQMFLCRDKCTVGKIM